VLTFTKLLEVVDCVADGNCEPKLEHWEKTSPINKFIISMIGK